jgi:hypothetical protein
MSDNDDMSVTFSVSQGLTTAPDEEDEWRVYGLAAFAVFLLILIPLAVLISALCPGFFKWRSKVFANKCSSSSASTSSSPSSSLSDSSYC